VTREPETKELGTEHEPWIEELLEELVSERNGEGTVVLPRRPVAPTVAQESSAGGTGALVSEGFTVVIPRPSRPASVIEKSEEGTVVLPRGMPRRGGIATATADAEATRVGNIEHWYPAAANSESETTVPKAGGARWLEPLRQSSRRALPFVREHVEAGLLRFRALGVRQRIMLMLAPFAVPAAVIIVSPKEAALPNRTEPRRTAVIERAAAAPKPKPSQSAIAAPVRSAEPRGGAAASSLSRRAADAIAAGNEAHALELYTELAAAEPNAQVYAKARDILLRRRASEDLP